MAISAALNAYILYVCLFAELPLNLETLENICVYQDTG